MRSSRIFFIGIAVAAVLIFILQLRVPQRFSWKESFSPYDRQPFGCYVFDSIMRHSFGGDYQVVHKTLRQLNHEKEYRNSNILIISTSMNLGDVDLNSLDSLLQNGAQVMIAYGPKYIEDSVLYKKYGIVVNASTPFNISWLKTQLTTGFDEEIYDTIQWNSPVHGYPKASYSIYKLLLSASLSGRNRKAETHGIVSWVDHVGSLSTENDTLSVLTSVRRGKGELIVASMPLLFTNYGILDKNTSPFTHRLMTLIASRPIVRTTAYTNTPDMEAARLSPFRYLLSQRPLRWALWLSLLLIALFMVFTARRQQRVIPIETPPRNHTLEFIGLIGTLYYQQRDHADLLRKKWGYFAEELRSRLDLDITEAQNDNASADILARRTGMDKLETAALLCEVRQALQIRYVTDHQLQSLIGRMNEIMKKYKILKLYDNGRTKNKSQYVF